MLPLGRRDRPRFVRETLPVTINPRGCMSYSNRHSGTIPYSAANGFA